MIRESTCIGTQLEADSKALIAVTIVLHHIAIQNDSILSLSSERLSCL